MNAWRRISALADKFINARPPVPANPGKVAGLLATRNYKNGCSMFEALSDLCDATIVLDDNSDVPFPHRERCTEYIQLKNRAPWNASANLTLLLYRAFVHGYEWVVTVDDDLLFSAGFQTRADVRSVVEMMISGRLDVCHFRLRDLWNSPNEYRGDGVWSAKTFPVVRRNWFFYDRPTFQDPARRLHAGAFPVNLRARWNIHEAHLVYHTGCLSPADRAARVEKYRQEDPDGRFQKDYEYMLDDAGLLLRPVPESDRAVLSRRLRMPQGPG